MTYVKNSATTTKRVLCKSARGGLSTIPVIGFEVEVDCQIEPELKDCVHSQPCHAVHV